MKLYTQLIYEFLKENGIQSYHTTILNYDCIFITMDPHFAAEDYPGGFFRTNEYSAIGIWPNDNGVVTMEYENPDYKPARTLPYGGVRHIHKWYPDTMDVNIHDPNSLQEILAFIKKYPDTFDRNYT